MQLHSEFGLNLNLAAIIVSYCVFIQRAVGSLDCFSKSREKFGKLFVHSGHWFAILSGDTTVLLEYNLTESLNEDF